MENNSINKREEDVDWNIRPYSKSELARAYSPQTCNGAALNKLSKWIRHSAGLYLALQQTGYTDKQKIFTPKQVRIIFDYLGKP